MTYCLSKRKEIELIEKCLCVVFFLTHSDCSVTESEYVNRQIYDREAETDEQRGYLDDFLIIRAQRKYFKFNSYIDFSQNAVL